VAIYYYFSKRDKRMSKYPPGPMGIPILGNALQLGKEPHHTFIKWSKKYGKTISVQLALDRCVVLNDLKMIRDMFNETAFSGRPQNELFLALSGGNYGVLNSDGPTWESQRRFTLRHLRDFGFGKNSMELLIMEEVREMIEWMKNEEGHPLSLNRKFSLAVLNSLWQIVSGKRFDQKDTTLNDLLDSTTKTFNEVSSNGILIFAPWLSKYFPNLSGHNKINWAVKQLVTFFRKTVEDHKDSDPDQDQPENFIEYYMKEIKKTNDPQSTFYKENGMKNLIAVVGDLFQAGSETTSTTLAWAVLYLLREPETQKKLQAEIDSVIGKSRNPTLADRPDMPYTEAVIMEVLRYSSLVPTGVFHRTLFDKEMHGYFFPKGTWIMPNLYAVHHDKEIWGDPENFRPERFLKDGKVVSKPEAFLPFVVGKRACIGETLARDSLFLFMASIFQRFQILPDPSNPKPTIQPGFGFLLAPKPFTVILKDRLEA